MALTPEQRELIRQQQATSPLFKSAPSQQGDISAGISSGMQIVAPSTPGGLMQVAGRALGLEGVAEQGIAAQQSAEAERARLREGRPTQLVPAIKEGDVGAVADIAQFGAAEQLPRLAATSIASGAGWLIGKRLGSPKLGASLGAYLSNLAQMLPDTLSEQRERGVESVPKALATTAAQAGAETLSDVAMLLAGRAGLKQALTAPGVMGRALGAAKGLTRGAAIGVAAETPTEVAQEALAIEGLKWADPTYQPTPEEYKARLLEAGAQGALIGGVLAGGAGSVGGAVSRRPAPPRAPFEEPPRAPSEEPPQGGGPAPSPEAPSEPPAPIAPAPLRQYADLAPFVSKATAKTPITEGTIVAPLKGEGRPERVVKILQSSNEAVLADIQTGALRRTSVTDLGETLGIFDYDKWYDQTAQEELPLDTEAGKQAKNVRFDEPVALPQEEIDLRREIDARLSQLSGDEKAAAWEAEQERRARVEQELRGVAEEAVVNEAQLDLPLPGVTVDFDTLIDQGVSPRMARKMVGEGFGGDVNIILSWANRQKKQTNEIKDLKDAIEDIVAKRVVPSPTPQPVTLEAVPEAAPKVVPEAAPKVVPEAAPKVVPEAAPKVVPEAAPEAVPAPQATARAPIFEPAAVPEETPVAIPEEAYGRAAVETPIEITPSNASAYAYGKNTRKQWYSQLQDAVPANRKKLKAGYRFVPIKGEVVKKRGKPFQAYGLFKTNAPPLTDAQLDEMVASYSTVRPKDVKPGKDQRKPAKPKEATPNDDFEAIKALLREEVRKQEQERAARAAEDQHRAAEEEAVTESQAERAARYRVAEQGALTAEAEFEAITEAGERARAASIERHTTDIRFRIDQMLTRLPALKAYPIEVSPTLDDLPVDVRGILERDFTEAVTLRDGKIYVVADRLPVDPHELIIALRTGFVRALSVARFFSGSPTHGQIPKVFSVDELRSIFAKAIAQGDYASLSEAFTALVNDFNPFGDAYSPSPEVSQEEAARWVAPEITRSSSERTMEARGGASAKGMSIEAVQARLRALPAFFRNYDIRVVNDPTVEARGGVTDAGVVYLYANNLSPETVLPTLRHEIVGHLGMRWVVGEEGWQRILVALHESKGTQFEDLRAWAKKNYPESPNLQANEMLARAAEMDMSGRLFAKIWGLIRSLLRRAGVLRGEMTWDDLRGMVLVSSLVTRFAPNVVKGYETPGMMLADNISDKVKTDRMDARGEAPTMDELFDRMQPPEMQTMFGKARDKWRDFVQMTLPKRLLVTPLQTLNYLYGGMVKTPWAGREGVNYIEEFSKLSDEQSAIVDGRNVKMFPIYTRLQENGDGQRDLWIKAVDFATVRQLRLPKPGEDIHKIQPWSEQQWEESGSREKFGLTLEQAVDELDRYWRAVPKETQATVLEAAAAMEETFDENVEALIFLIERHAQDADKAKALVRDLRQRKRKLKGTYWPMMRFGSYGVIGYNADGIKIIDRWFDTPGEARKFKAEFAKTAPEGTVIRDAGRMDQHEQALRSEANIEYIGGIRQALTEAFALPDDPSASHASDQINHVIDHMVDLLLADLPDKSFSQFERHRAGIAGYSLDFPRAFANYMLRGNAMVGALRFGTRKRALLKDMRSFVEHTGHASFDPPPGFNTYTVTALYNSLLQRERNLTIKSSPLIPLASQITFLNLLTSPSQWVVNLTQVPMYWAPLVGAVEGIGLSKAYAEMTRTMREAMTGAFSQEAIQSEAITKQYAVLFHRDKRSFEYDFGLTEEDKARLKTPEARERAVRKARDAFIAELEKTPEGRRTAELLFLHHMAETGKLQLGLTYSLLAESEHGRDTVPGKVGMGWDAFLQSKWVSGAMRHSEQINRTVSGLGAYRLFRDNKGASFMQALDMGMRFTDESQFNYARVNRIPLFGASPALRLIHHVQSFRIMSIAMLVSRAYKGFVKGDAEAKRAFWYLNAATAVIAGVRGTPLFGAAALFTSALNWLLEDEDELDINKATELGFREFFGEGVGTALSRGLPAGAGVDLYSRAQLANLLMPNMLDAPEAMTGAARANWIAAQVLGPVWAPVTGFQKMLEALDRNESMLQSVSHFTPKPLRDAFRAYEMLIAGKPVKGSGGTAIVPAGELGYHQVLLMGLGIQPTVVTTARIDDRFVADRMTVIGQTRTKIVTGMRNAILDKDAAGIEEWGERMEEFNRKNPAYGIMFSDLKQSVKRRYEQDLGIHRAQYEAEKRRIFGQ